MARRVAKDCLARIHDGSVNDGEAAVLVPDPEESQILGRAD